MKFQNPSFKIFLNGRTDKQTQTHGQTDGQAESNMLPTFSKLGAYSSIRLDIKCKKKNSFNFDVVMTMHTFLRSMKFRI